MESGSLFSPSLKAMVGMVGPADHIDVGKDPGKILPDILPCDLRLCIIFPVIARGEGKGPEHDPAPDFGAEPLPAYFLECLVPRLFRIGCRTVPHAVEPGKVGTCLAGADHIVRGKGVLHRGNAARDGGGPEFFEPCRSPFSLSLRPPGRHLCRNILRGMPILRPFDVSGSGVWV